MIQKVWYNPGHGITITGDYCIKGAGGGSPTENNI